MKKINVILGICIIKTNLTFHKFRSNTSFQKKVPNTYSKKKKEVPNTILCAESLVLFFLLYIMHLKLVNKTWNFILNNAFLVNVSLVYLVLRFIIVISTYYIIKSL